MAAKILTAINIFSLSVYYSLMKRLVVLPICIK